MMGQEKRLITKETVVNASVGRGRVMSVVIGNNIKIQYKLEQKSNKKSES